MEVCDSPVTTHDAREATLAVTINDVTVSHEISPFLSEIAKRRRTEKGRTDSGDSGNGSSTSPQGMSPNELFVERPVRAASSSPVGTAMEHEPLVRNRKGRTSLGSDFRVRVQSPSDKRQSLDFYKDALMRDSSINRSQFLSGHWLRQSTSRKNVTVTKSDPQSQTRTHPEVHVPHVVRHIKRKQSNDCMDTMGRVGPYYMCLNVADSRDDNRLIPNRDASNVDMARVNVEMLYINMKEHWEPQLDKLAKLYGMNHRDEVHISRTTMREEYEKKLKIFFEEHLHKDPEVRLIKSGSGFFDVRSATDEWIRIPVCAGDFLFLPSGLYHRFSTDHNDNIVAVRLFATVPKWEAYNRSENGDEQSERRQFLLTNGLIEEKE